MAITIFLLCGGDKGLVMLIYKLSVIPKVRPSEFHVSVFLLIIRRMLTSHLYMLTAPAVTSVNLYNIFQSQLTMCEIQFLFSLPCGVGERAQYLSIWSLSVFLPGVI